MTKLTWDQVGPLPTAKPFFDSPSAPAAPAMRGDRAFFGGAKWHGQQTDGNVTGGSWLQSFPSTGLVSPVVNLDYAEDTGRLVSVCDFGVAVSGASRTIGALDAIGLLGLAVANGTAIKPATGRPYVSWGAYIEGVSQNGSAHGAEVNAARVGSVTPRGAATPYDNFAGLDMAIGLAVCGGADAVVWGASWPISAHIEIRNNGASAYTGINFRNNSLLREGTTPAAGAVGAAGYGRAIAMAFQHGISWYSRDPSGGVHTESVRISSDVANSTVRYGLVFNDGAFAINEREGAGGALFQVIYRGDAESNLAAAAGGAGQAPRLQARGLAANISMFIEPKGEGWVSFAAIDNVRNYADDAAAAAGGLNIGAIYRTGSILKVRAA